MRDPFGRFLGGLASGICGMMTFWNGVDTARRGEFLPGAVIASFGIMALSAGFRLWMDGLPPKDDRADILKMPGSEPKEPPSWWEV